MKNTLSGLALALYSGLAGCSSPIENRVQEEPMLTSNADYSLYINSKLEHVDEDSFPIYYRTWMDKDSDHVGTFDFPYEVLTVKNSGKSIKLLALQPTALQAGDMLNRFYVPCSSMSFEDMVEKAGISDLRLLRFTTIKPIQKGSLDIDGILVRE